MNRSISESQRVWLKGELDAWRALGLVSDDQAGAVLSLYGTEEDAAQARQSRALTILLSLSALMGALGVFLLIGYNWSELPDFAKLFLIFAVLTGVHVLGLALKYRWELPKAAEAAFFFGCLLFGGGIALIGQIFNVNSEDAGAFWWWALGVLPFALALDSMALHVLYAGLLGVWAGYEILGFGHLGAWLFGRWGFLPDGAYSLLAMAAPGFAWAYKKNQPKALGLYVPLVCWWVILQVFAWDFDNNPVYLVGTIGASLLVISEMHRQGSPMAIPYRLCGTGMVAGALVPLSFRQFYWSGLWHAAGAVSSLYLILGTVVLTTVILVVGLLVMRRRAERDGTTPLSFYSDFLRQQRVPIGLWILFTALSFWRILTENAALFPVIAVNIAMVTLAFWLIRIGLRDDWGRAFAAGVAYFLLWTILRYIDLFGDFGGMLGAALMFFLCGFALFGVAMFWRRRKGVSLA